MTNIRSTIRTRIQALLFSKGVAIFIDTFFYIYLFLFVYFVVLGIEPMYEIIGRYNRHLNF